MSSQSVQRIVALANQLRQERPNQYGIKGTKPGNPGYIKDGWKNAVKTAAELYYRETGKTPKAKQPSVTSQVMDALYRGWLMALRQLREKYHKAGLRTVATAKIKVSQKQRQRLPPTILSYMQAKTKTSTPLPKQTKTKNPFPKQIIVEPQTMTNNPVEPQTKTNNPVEPQMNIVQES